MKAANERVHALLAPLGGVSLLFPSALVAEVVNPPAALLKTPLSPPWMLGLLSWRSRPVPVIAFDALLGAPAFAPGPRSKIVIFYPLEGRPAWEFFGILTSTEPQPRTFYDQKALENLVESDSRFLAAMLRLDKSTVGIPDLGALYELFYPPPA